MSLINFGKKEVEKEPEILSVFPQDIYDAGIMELQDVIAPSALEINSNFLKLGEKVVRTIFVFSYPRFLSINWFSPIINLDKVFDVSIFIHPTDTGTVLRQLQKKVAEVQSQIHMREEKGLVRDPGLDTAHADLEDLFDIFSMENYNSVTFAKACAGKSYATKLEVLRSLMFGTDVIVIDPEREYEQLVEATGGRSFHISLSSEHHINPFDLPPVKEDEDPKDILRSN